jgi:hypothetical protein
MTDRVQKNLTDYCASLLVEHGFDYPVNDPVLPALYVIHKDMQQNNQKNQAIADAILEASKKFNPKQFIFNSSDAASKFQRGITIRWSIIAGLAALIAWVAAWHWSMRNDVDKARTIIGVSGNVGVLLQAAKKDKSGAFFIDFTAARGDSIRHFTEYENLNGRTVRVYLGRKIR